MLARPLGLLALLLTAGGCGGQSAPAPQAPAQPAAVAPDGGKPVARRPSRLRRSEMLSVLSAGFPSFLSRIEVKPAFEKGRFHGWRIVALHWEGTAMADADLQPGDVVTSVNGGPIERPEQGQACFQSLAVASELRVAYERGQEKRQLSYPIDDDPPPGK
jgi:type II secretory pathway component PulC